MNCVNGKREAHATAEPPFTVHSSPFTQFQTWELAVLHNHSPVTTIEAFILEQESRYPEATGELSNLLYDIALAAKIIAAAIRRAGLVNILGSIGQRNVQGEEQQKLDVFANDTIKNSLKHTGRVCVMGSEEDEDIIPIPPEFPLGKYAVLFDPTIGEFLLSHPHIVTPRVGTYYSVNESNFGRWDKGFQTAVWGLKGDMPD